METQVTKYADNNTSFDMIIRGKEFIEALMTIEDDPNNNPLFDNFKYKDKDGKEQISKSQALATIVLGHELGLSPLVSLQLGKEITPSKMFAIDAGKRLGLSPLQSLKKIHTIPTKGGYVLFMGIDLITSQLIKAKVQFKLVKDREPVYSYLVKGTTGFVPTTKDRVLDEDGKLMDKYFLIDDTSTQDEVNKAKESNKKFVQRIVTDYVTSWELKREGYEPFISDYFRSEAVAAGLLPSFNSKGEKLTDGKTNWLMDERKMLQHRALSRGGRTYAADVLENSYEKESELDTFDYVEEVK